MKGYSIRELLEEDPYIQQHFDGIVTKDTLRSIRRDQHFLILNSDEHWALIFRSNAVLECFDSLGWQEHNLDIFSNNELSKDIVQIRLSTKRYQPIGSESCGAYCLYLAYKRLYFIDQPFSTVLSGIFNDEPEVNETIVSDFYNNLLKQRENRLQKEQKTNSDGSLKNNDDTDSDN